MKVGIHPEYQKALITCACGRVTETRATVGEIHVEICSHCHPFFTGRQKLVDTAGRVERFIAKYGIEGEEEDADAAELAETSKAAVTAPEAAATEEEEVTEEGGREEEGDVTVAES